MPIEYNIDEEQQLVWVTGSGTITGKDVISHLGLLAHDTSYIPPMKKLVDYRNIETIKITQDEAETIAQTKNSFNNKFAGEICAFVAPVDLTYGTARVHQARVGNDIDIKVCRTIEEALEYLVISIDSSQTY